MPKQAHSFQIVTSESRAGECLLINLLTVEENLSEISEPLISPNLVRLT
ncbi:MAG: hypothetical protein F6K31_14180 [Symploca sp. SIO2G7]|nr:hypothetical protein [Symploca sp. SIO2G7]